MASRRLKGEGCIWLSDIGSTGQGTNWVEMGETSSLGISVNYDFLTARNTCLKGSPQVMKIPINPVVTLNMTSESFHKENLARFFFSEWAYVTTSTLVDEIWIAPNGTAFEENVWYVLPNDYKDPGTITFKDNTGTPVTITNTKYVFNRWGRVMFTDLDTYVVDRIRISGAVNRPDTDAALIEKVGIATGVFKPFALQYEGLYTIDNGVENFGLLVLHKVQLNPNSVINFKSPDAFATVDMTGDALANEDLPVDAFFGNTGSFIWLNKGAA